MHTRITEAHIRSVAVMDSYVTASARYTVDYLELDAECSIDMRPDGMDDGTPEISDAEIEVATRQAISGVIGKLQSVVTGRFARSEIRFEDSAAAKARSAAVGEKAAARPLAACEAVTPKLPPVDLHAVIEAFAHNHETGAGSHLSIQLLRVEPDGKFSYVDTIIINERKAVAIDGSIYTLHCEPFSEACAEIAAQWLRRDTDLGKGQRGKISIVHVDIGWCRLEAQRFAKILRNDWGFMITTKTVKDLPRATPAPVAEMTESEAEQSWRDACQPVYQKLFHDMGVSVPARLSMPHLEATIREIVDGRTSLIRNLEGVPGWIIGGVTITLEGVLQRSDRAFESLVRGVVMTR